MTGTFGGALEARGISASDGALTADVRGEVEKEDDGVIVIRRIHVMYLLKAGEEHRETIERVHDFHADKCPVYRSICGSIDITTDYELEG
ncbi:MAG: OsmC family protein [Gemmatimonadota bacterium]|nr:OsmC family protein [Gemmatimonadota bacterium]